MLTEREVLALERVKEKLRAFRDKVSEAQSALRTIASDDADTGNYDFETDGCDEFLEDVKSQVSDAILLIETDIEEYDEGDE